MKPDHERTIRVTAALPVDSREGTPGLVIMSGHTAIWSVDLRPTVRRGPYHLASVAGVVHDAIDRATFVAETLNVTLEVDHPRLDLLAAALFPPPPTGRT